MATFLRLVIADLHVADFHTSRVAVNRPRILLYPVNAVRISHIVIDINHADRVVRTDSYIISIISRSVEQITVYSVDESFTIFTFFFEVYLPFIVVVFRVYDDGIVLLGVRAAYQRDTESICITCRLYGE